jgi:hypothetical protein
MNGFIFLGIISRPEFVCSLKFGPGDDLEVVVEVLLPNLNKLLKLSYFVLGSLLPIYQRLNLI